MLHHARARPARPYKKHPTEPRLMVAREPGEFGGSTTG
jgi:hypothetical protein